MIFIGVDPGKGGGLAALNHIGHVLNVVSMPESDSDLYRVLSLWGAQEGRAYLEKVHAFPGEGVTSSFRFGSEFGRVKMALVAAEIPFELVTPYTWQRAVGVMRKGKSQRADHKRALKNRALELFPGARVTMATCDALLIAEYGRLKEKGCVSSCRRIQTGSGT